MSTRERKRREWSTTPARRRLILDAALRCFDEKGVAATSIDDICGATGLSVGSIYHHFAGKDDIFEQLIEEAMTEHRSGVVDALLGGKDLEQSIRRLVRFHLKWVDERAALSRMMLRWEEAERGTPRGVAHYREYSEGMGEWLLRETKAKRIRRMVPDLYSVLLMGPLMEYARERSAGLTSTPRAVMERGLIDGLLRLLRV